MRFEKRDIRRFIYWSLAWTILVTWMNAWWFLLGNLIIADIFLTQFIDWSLKRYNITKTLRKTLEWITYVVIAVTISVAVKVLFVEAYKIPSPSME